MPPFNLQSLLSQHTDTLDLHEQFINPAIVGVLRTIGFDARYAKGEGAYLFDEAGTRYLDCLGGYAVFAAGRNHPVIKDAIKQALDANLPNLPGVGIFRTSGILAKELISLVPGNTAQSPSDKLSKVFFANGGAEAVDVALKQARIATGRAGFVHCTRSYHGLTMGALSVTGNHEFREGFGELLRNTVEIPFNDLAALEQALSPRDKAAFIVEPIQGKGVNLPSADYLRDAAALCKKYGTLFILDEIQTGLGRTGRWFAAEHYGMGSADPAKAWFPDIIVIAKALSGGMIPVSAVISREWVHTKVFPSMNHCSRIQTTFGQNDLAMVAGLASLHVLKTENLLEHTHDVGNYLMAGLQRMVGKYEMVKEVRGQGLMVAIEFERPRSLTLKMGWDLLHKLDESLFCQAIIMPLMSDHKILAQVAGHRLDVIKLIPPLVFSKQDADEVIAAMDTCVKNCHQFPGPAWEVGKKLSAAAVRRFQPGVPSSPRPEPAGV